MVFGQLMNRFNALRRWPWDLLAILFVAVLFRLVLLDLKPPHFDEGINGWFADVLRETGFHKYDPTNFHGPWHFYTVFLSQELLGRNLWALRLPVVIASLLTIPAIFLFARWFGRPAVRWAALAFAVSPAEVFFGRYSIHETWFVLCTLLFTWGAIALWLERDRAGLWAAVLGLAGMILNKETYLIHAGSLAIAAGVFALWGKVSPVQPPVIRPTARSWSVKDAWTAGSIAVFLLVFFYSGNFLNLKGLRGPYDAIAAWTQTGTSGEGHEKTAYELLPFVNYYWLAILARYEWPALAGLIWSVRYAWPAPAAPRLLAILGGGVLLAYSLVPYKTPWCILAIVWPWFLFFGAAIESAGRRWAKIIGIILLVASAALAVRVNFFGYEDDSEPYVYVQTYHSIETLTGPLLALSSADPRQALMPGAIYLESYYPLPWILGDFPNLGYFGGEIPKNFPKDAKFHVIESKRADEIRPLIGAGFTEKTFKLRSGMDECVVFFSDDLLVAAERLPHEKPPRRAEP
jgi:uncharacterized protein (TIGR03663 family)